MLPRYQTVVVLRLVKLSKAIWDLSGKYSDLGGRRHGRDHGIVRVYRLAVKTWTKLGDGFRGSPTVIPCLYLRMILLRLLLLSMLYSTAIAASFHTKQQLDIPGKECIYILMAPS